MGQNRIFYAIAHCAYADPRFYLTPDDLGTGNIRLADQYATFADAVRAAASKKSFLYKFDGSGIGGRAHTWAIVRVEEVPGSTTRVLAKDTRRVDLSKPVVVYEVELETYLDDEGLSCDTLDEARVFDDGADAIASIIQWTKETGWVQFTTHLINVETVTTESKYIETVLA